MKKIMSILVLVCIVASLCTVSAFAANYSAQWIEAYKEGTPGTASYKEAFTCSFNVDGGEAFVVNSSMTVDWYQGSTLLGRSTLNSSKIPFSNTAGSISCSAVIYGKASSSWTTEWYVPMDGTTLPDNVIASIDNNIVIKGGTVIAATPGIYDSLSAPDMPVVVKNGSTVAGYYDSIDEAVAAAPSGANVIVREAGTYAMPDAQGKNLTISASVSGVTIDMSNSTGDNSNVGFDTNVNVNNPNAPVNPNPNPNPNPGTNPNPAPAAPAVENIYYVPATDDNSNMALWSILALALITTAFVTRKKKTEN